MRHIMGILCFDYVVLLHKVCVDMYYVPIEHFYKLTHTGHPNKVPWHLWSIFFYQVNAWLGNSEMLDNAW